MIIEFVIKNFLSFKNETIFSMSAAKSVKECCNFENGISNVQEIEGTNQRIVKVASVYGANGSGKSNLVKAMSFFRTMILNSFKNDHILTGFFANRFLLDTISEKESIGFEMTFIIDKTIFRYGFEILDDKVDSEWLFQQEPDSQKESYCFKRNKAEIQINNRTFRVAKEAEIATRNNALFLSTAAIYNSSTAIKLKDWFTSHFNIISGINDTTLNFTAEQYKNNDEMRHRILDFIKIIDLGIRNISVEEALIDSISESTIIPNDPMIRKIVGSMADAMIPSGNKIKEIDIKAIHDKYDNEEIVGETSFPFNNESVGTRKIFALLGPWFDTLARGGVLIVDEFGASIHTKLAIELIRLFQSKLNNSLAQLVVTTHDTNILRKDLLRRDQIWFTEKDAKGASDLYSLVEYKINQATSVRNDASFGKDYLLGKYGAIPYFGNMDKFISDFCDDGK